MFRTSDTVLIAVMVAAAAFTYKTKHDAETRYREMRKIEAQIRFEETTIDVLKADWSVLTQPQRLQQLTESFQTQLGLRPTDARQFIDLASLPDKPAAKPEGDPVGDLVAKAGKDTTITGSVKKKP